MNNQDIIDFRNKQNSSETELEFLGFLLYELKQIQGENNELTSQIIATDIKESDKRSLESQKMQEQGEISSSLLSSILDEIHKKDIDLSDVIDGLESIRTEIVSSRKEEKDTKPLEEQRSEKLLASLSNLLEVTKENKPEKMDMTPMMEMHEKGEKKTHELLSALLAEIATIDIKPEVKVDIPKEVEVQEPKWYKPFLWEKKWIEPIVNSIDAINPKKILEKIEGIVEKILDKPFPEIPKTKDGRRILVEVDRTGGGGNGVIDKNGLPINPATEETLQAILASSGGSVYNYITSASDATYKYYGYASSTGWQFKRKTLATGVWEISSGTGDFDTNWSDRSNKVYSYV